MEIFSWKVELRYVDLSLCHSHSLRLLAVLLALPRYFKAHEGGNAQTVSGELVMPLQLHIG